MDISQLSIDVPRATAGVWVKYREDVEWLIASTATAEYAEAQAKKFEKIFALDGDRESDAFKALVAEAEIELLCDHVLKGWRGLTSQGVPVPYSREKARELLSAPGAFHVVRFIRLSAAQLDLYRAEQVAAQGNA